MKNNNYLCAFLLGLSMVQTTNVVPLKSVLFKAQDIPLQVKRVEKVMSQLALRKKIATGVGIAGAALLIHYYYPGLLSSLLPKKIKTLLPKEVEMIDVLHFDHNLLSKKVSEHDDNIKQLMRIHNDKLAHSRGVPFAIFNFLKRHVPVVVATGLFQNLFPVFDRYMHYIKATCFAQVNLAWFEGWHTRYPHFMKILEEQAHLIACEKNSVNQELIIIQMNDACACVVDHCAGIIGYMAYQQQALKKSNEELSESIKHIMLQAAQELELFSLDIQEICSSKNYIALPGRIESFKEVFDSARRNFV
ncbi:hypothetical protein EBU24_06990, partial [bacterium]|nr:hypothetical protein [bacterium]